MKTGTRILIALLLLSTIPAAAAPPAKKSKIWLAYERAERFGNMGNLVYKSNVDARWVGDTHQFWYRNDVRGKSEWVLIDADTGKRTVYPDASKLPKSTTPAEPTRPGRGQRRQDPASRPDGDGQITRRQLCRHHQGPQHPHPTQGRRGQAPHHRRHRQNRLRPRQLVPGLQAPDRLENRVRRQPAGLYRRKRPRGLPAPQAPHRRLRPARR